MNVLVIMCDHHRHDALGCLGDSIAHTPNLDRLAAESTRFSECYNQSPVCAPARHLLATGQYVHCHGVINNSYKPFPGMQTGLLPSSPWGIGVSVWGTCTGRIWKSTTDTSVTSLSRNGWRVCHLAVHQDDSK